MRYPQPSSVAPVRCRAQPFGTSLRALCALCLQTGQSCLQVLKRLLQKCDVHIRPSLDDLPVSPATGIAIYGNFNDLVEVEVGVARVRFGGCTMYRRSGGKQLILRSRSVLPQRMNDAFAGHAQ